MPAADPPRELTGQPLLDAITDAMVALHVRYYHRTPRRARTQLLADDMLACTFHGIYTDVEKTMIELQHQDVVHDTRQSFELAMQHRFVNTVERLSGRTVAAFVANHHVGPDMAVQLFLLKPVDTAA